MEDLGRLWKPWRGFIQRYTACLKWSGRYDSAGKWKGQCQCLRNAVGWECWSILVLRGDVVRVQITR